MPEKFAQLFKQDFSDLDSSATSWKKLSEALGKTQAGSGKRVTGPLHEAGWTGVSASYGFNAMEATESQLGTARINAQLIATTLDTVCTKMQEAQRKLRKAVADAEEAGHVVLADGWVEPRQVVEPKYHNDPDYQGVQQQANTELGGFRARIDAAISEATSVSYSAAEILHQIDPFDLDKRYGGAHAQEDAARVAEFLGIDKKDIPDGKDPKRSAEWWDGLNEEKQRMYLAAFPGQVGELDGLPTTTRDQANRTVLDMRINDYALREGSLGHHDRYGYRSLSALKDRLDKADGASTHRQLYLLNFNTEKDGRAVIAVGNPDTATHTAVQVPETSNQLDNVGDQIDRAYKLQSAAAVQAEGGSQDVSVVSWLDYDAPEAKFEFPDFELNPAIATEGRSQDGAEDLRDFTHGLRAAHEGERTHLTVLAHSYGSTTAGAADAGGQGLDADDMVVLGSPGLTVDHADKLHVNPDHLWVGAADDDLVSNIAAGSTLGADPKQSDFGAQRMHVDTEGHSGYWDDHSQSLLNQGRIIAGMSPKNPASQ